MFDLLPVTFSITDLAVVAGASLVLGLLAGRYRGRAGRWLSWRIYHAGVHLPRFGRR